MTRFSFGCFRTNRGSSSGKSEHRRDRNARALHPETSGAAVPKIGRLAAGHYRTSIYPVLELTEPPA